MGINREGKPNVVKTQMDDIGKKIGKLTEELRGTFKLNKIFYCWRDGKVELLTEIYEGEKGSKHVLLADEGKECYSTVNVKLIEGNWLEGISRESIRDYILLVEIDKNAKIPKNHKWSEKKHFFIESKMPFHLAMVAKAFASF